MPEITEIINSIQKEKWLLNSDKLYSLSNDEIDKRILLNLLSGRESLTFQHSVTTNYNPRSVKNIYRCIVELISVYCSRTKRKVISFWYRMIIRIENSKILGKGNGKIEDPENNVEISEDNTGNCTIKELAMEIINAGENCGYWAELTMDIDGKKVNIEAVVTFVDGKPCGQQFTPH